MSLYYYYQMYLASQQEDSTVTFQLFDTFHFISMIVCRCIVISVKYGFMSYEHMYFYRNLKLSPRLLAFDLVFTVVNETSIKNIAERMKFDQQLLKIDQNQFNFEIFED